MPAAQYDVFLSHNSRDKAAVERIATKLRDAGLEPWLDVWCLTPGGRWQEEIGVAMATCRACAVFVGPHGIGDWVREELQLATDRAAKDRSFRVFPVLLPGLPDPFDPSTLPPFLATHTWVDLRAGFEQDSQFRALQSAVVGVPLGPSVSSPVTGAVCPYRGLQTFDEAHEEFFFGRDADVQRLIERLKGTRFLAVVGASGSGKSSLVRAGLLPALRKGALPGSDTWSIAVFSPGAHPLAALVAQLLPFSPYLALGTTLDQLTSDERTLHLATAAVLAGQSPPARLALIVDQFEEIFTLCRDESERRRFVDNLLYAAAIPGGQCLVVLTMRADFYPRCASFPSLAAQLATQQYLVSPLDEDGLLQAIVEPAALVGLEFEEGLVSTILDDVQRQPGGLPLLEHALLELWERRRGRLLTLEGYQSTGGVARAIAKRADAVYDGLGVEQQAIARRILLRLTQPGEGTEDTRRRATLDELVRSPIEREATEAVVSALAESRLATTSGDDQGITWVDVAHEALIRSWPRLRSWIEEDRAGLRAHRRLTETAQEWQRLGRDEALLYRGSRLASALEFRDRSGEQLNELEREFLTASTALIEREREHQEQSRRQRERLQRLLAAVFLVGFVVASLLAVAAWDQRAGAQSESRRRAAAQQTAEAGRIGAEAALVAQQTAESRGAEAEHARQTAEARRLGETEAGRQTAVAIGNEAAAQATNADVARRTAVSERARAETEATAASTARRLALSGQLAAQVRNGELSTDLSLLFGQVATDLNVGAPDAEGALLASLDRAAPLVTMLHGHDALVWSVAFSEDGRFIASSDAAGVILIWDAATRAPVRAPLTGHTDAVFEVAFSPDGTLLASVGQDGTLRFWDPSTGESLGDPIPAHSAGASDLAFSPDGSRLATIGADNGIRVWDVETRQVLVQKYGDGGGGVDVAFSPDGTRLATAGIDGVVRLWDASSLAPGAQFVRSEGDTWPVNAVAFSPDGTRLAGASSGGVVLLWSLDSPGPPSVVLRSGLLGGLVALDFGATGTLAAGGFGGAALWEVESGLIITDRLGSGDAVKAIAFSPDDALFATAGDNGGVALWRSTPQPAVGQRLEPVNAPLYDVAFDPTGSRIASAGSDGTIRTWDTARPGSAHELANAHAGGAWSVAFRPDGALLASGGADGAVRVWDASTWQPVSAIPGAHSGIVFDVAFSIDGTILATAGQDGSVRLWDAVTGEPAGAPIVAHPNGVAGVSFAPDDRVIATTGFDGALRLWDVSTRTKIAEVILAHAGGGWEVAFDPAGKLLASVGGDGNLSVWSVEPLALVATIDHLAGTGFGVAFSPDGETLVAVGTDGVTLADMHERRPVAKLQSGHPYAYFYGSVVYAAAFSPDGTRLVTVGQEGAPLIWDMRRSSWREAVCTKVHRNPTRGEWRQLLGDVPYEPVCAGLPIPAEPEVPPSTPVAAPVGAATPGPTEPAANSPTERYASPAFGFSLAWSEPWRSSQSATPASGEVLTLTDGTGMLTMTAEEAFAGDATACLEATASKIRSRGVQARAVHDAIGRPLQGKTSNSAFGVYAVDGGPPGAIKHKLLHYRECFALVPGKAVLRVEHNYPAADAARERTRRQALFSRLVLPTVGSGIVSGDVTQELDALVRAGLVAQQQAFTSMDSTMVEPYFSGTALVSVKGFIESNARLGITADMKVDQQATWLRGFRALAPAWVDADVCVGTMDWQYVRVADGAIVGRDSRLPAPQIVTFQPDEAGRWVMTNLRPLPPTPDCGL